MYEHKKWVEINLPTISIIINIFRNLRMPNHIEDPLKF